MYGLHRLHSLVELNLSHNGILTIEGLKELTQLTHLNLASNNIKAIEHLVTNTRLEYLNLSDNSIGSISDISNLKSLKVSMNFSFELTSRNFHFINVPVWSGQTVEQVKPKF